MKNGDKIKIACVFGTRPEVIKMAPVIKLLKRNASFSVTLINTAQHREMVDDMLQLFELVPDVDLNIMQQNQSLSTLSGNLFLKLGTVLADNHYDVVLAQGDTTTTWVSAQVAFYNKIKFGHIEAGLRSNDIYQPFPEELNRVLVSRLATWHFCPTEDERDNLLKENINANSIFITGNTVIDNVRQISEKNVPLPFSIDEKKRIVLVTLHRRENFGQTLTDVLHALLTLAKRMPDIDIIYPVHPNPNVSKMAHEILSHQSNIRLLNPLPYDVFITLMKKAYLMMTDSGGIQEEAPFLNKPVLVLREKTERPLLSKLGLGILVGTQQQKIIETATDLLTNNATYRSFQKGISPYGDGYASERIVNVMADYFKLSTPVSDNLCNA